MDEEFNPHPLAGDPIEMQTFGPLPKAIDATLKERGSRYGDFRGHAAISQLIKGAMMYHSNEDYEKNTPRKWDKLSDDKKEALEMIAHKIGRILNGDPEYKDNWHDICGYAKLIDETLSD